MTDTSGAEDGVEPRSPEPPGTDPTPGAGAGEVGAGSAADPGDDSTADDGTEPDARFTMANERTFLAWNRTALALVVAGLAIAQLLPPFAGVPWGRSAIATPLILLGAMMSGLSYTEWKGNQRALRTGTALSRTQLPKVLAITITLIALLAGAVDLYSKATGR